MVAAVQKTQYIAPFFEDAVNQIFMQPNKSAYLMDGTIGMGKSSIFLIRTAYTVAQHVEPYYAEGKWVRESLWLGVRESGAAAVATLEQLIAASLFSHKILGRPDSPVRKYGSHPTWLEIKHKLPDDTYLLMKIECHGFGDEVSLGRLQSREFMGAIIPEMQTIPYAVFVIIMDRCGRWRTEETKIVREIDGKKYKLTGVQKLKIVIGDINIPKRDHPLYANYYDVPNKEDLQILMFTPPPPLFNKPVDTIPKDKVDKMLASGLARVTRFEGRDHLWYPNPEAYNMTRHYEEEDDDGNRIPWSGYKYWLNALNRPDSDVRRFIKGLPDTVGGDAAIYKTFDRDSSVKSYELKKDTVVWMGFDPGGSAAVELCQLRSNTHLHFFKEFFVEPVDGVSTRKLFTNFVFPYCRNNLKGMTVNIVPDPAATTLGKNKSVGMTESIWYQLGDEIKNEMAKHPEVKYVLTPCMVANQSVDVRIDSLGLFVDKGYLTIDKDCGMLVMAMTGGYKKHQLKSGTISDTIDKDNPFSHPAEAAQYPAINILWNIRRNAKRNQDQGRKVYRLKQSR